MRATLAPVDQRAAVIAGGAFHRRRRIALTVFAACCNDFDHFEVWNGATMISGGRGPRQPGHWRPITQAIQREMLDLEDRMRHTFACVSRSQQLLAAAAKLRTLITR